MAEVIGNGQALDALAVAQRATDKVHAPCLIDPCRSYQRCALATVLLAFSKVANLTSIQLIRL